MTQKQLSVSDTYDSMEFLKVTESGDDFNIVMHTESEDHYEDNSIFVSRDDFFKFINKLQKFKRD